MFPTNPPKTQLFASQNKAAAPVKNLYIKTTQDSIARINFKKSPEWLGGLYTDKLQTCMVVILVGDQGVSLIHDSGKTDVEDIVREFSMVGNIKHWTVANNPVKEASFEEKFARIMEDDRIYAQKKFFLEGKAGLKKYQIYKAKEGWIAISRNTEVFVAQKQKLSFYPQNEALLKYRENVIYVNNGLLRPTETMPLDVQFDGEHFLPPPKIAKTKSEIQSIFKSDPRYMNHPIGLAIQFRYASIKDIDPAIFKPADQPGSSMPLPPENTKITQTSTTQAKVSEQSIFSGMDPQKALRNAAFKGTPADIDKFAARVSDIDCQDNGKWQRTALHWAVLKKKADNIKKLLALGARYDIKDVNNKTALDYAEVKGFADLFSKVTATKPYTG